MNEKSPSTSDLLHRFNEAFLRHDPTLLKDLVDQDCVMESVEPAPDGTRYVGRDACLTFWQNLANNEDSAFEAEDIATFADRGIIRWRYRFGPGLSKSVRGVTVMMVREGRIVEALGYAKTGDASVATAVRDAARSER